MSEAIATLTTSQTVPENGAAAELSVGNLVGNTPRELFLAELDRRKKKNELLAQGSYHIGNLLNTRISIASILFGLVPSDIKEFTPEQIVQLDETIEAAMQERFAVADSAIQKVKRILRLTMTLTCTLWATSMICLVAHAHHAITFGFIDTVISILITATQADYYMNLTRRNRIDETLFDKFAHHQAAKKFLQEHPKPPLLTE